MFPQRQQVSPTDHYAILGVPRNASESSIRKAFHSLSLSAHPDKAGDSTEAHNRYVQILEAYSVLKDPAQRRAYDLTLRPTRRRYTPGGIFVVDLNDIFTREWDPAPAAQTRRSNNRGSSSRGWEHRHGNHHNHHHDGNATTSQGEADNEPLQREDTDNSVFDSFSGGYEAFQRDFEQWKQQQKQAQPQASSSTPSASPRTRTEAGTGGKKATESPSLPASLIHAHLLRQLAPLPPELEGLQFVLEALQEQLLEYIPFLRERSAPFPNPLHAAMRLRLGAALSAARRRVRQLDRRRRKAMSMLKELRASANPDLDLDLDLDLGLGLGLVVAQSVDALLVGVVEARAAVAEMDRLAVEIARVAGTIAFPTMVVLRDLAVKVLVEEFEAVVGKWGGAR